MVEAVTSEEGGKEVPLGNDVSKQGVRLVNVYSDWQQMCWGQQACNKPSQMRHQYLSHAAFVGTMSSQMGCVPC